MHELQFDEDDFLLEYMAKREFQVRHFPLYRKCVRSLYTPVDGKKWPKSWRKTSKRLETVLDEKDDEYFQVLAVLKDMPSEFLDKWNGFCALPVAKRIRVAGSSAKGTKVYSGSKYFWDLLLVFAYLGEKDLYSVIKDSVKGKSLDVLYPKWVWKYLKFWYKPPEQKKTSTTKSGVQVVEC